MKKSEDAAHVMPPREGLIGVTSVTAGSASAAITISAPTGCYVSIAIDDGAGVMSGAYITSKLKADPANPNPTATSGTGRCFYFPAEQIVHLRFNPDERIKVYVPGSGTKYVRQYASSPG